MSRDSGWHPVLFLEVRGRLPAGRDLGFALEDLWPLGTEERVARVLDRVRAAGVFPPDLTPERVRGYSRFLSLRRRAFQHYRPGKCGWPVLLLRTASGGSARENGLEELSRVAGDDLIAEWRAAGRPLARRRRLRLGGADRRGSPGGRGARRPPVDAVGAVRPLAGGSAMVGRRAGGARRSTAVSGRRR